MGASILDIAALAGVSKSTVSAVINNLPSVRPSTRERVLEAIRVLDYHPNLAARELCTSSPMNIGIIMPSYSHSDGEMGRYFDSINESSNLELVSHLIELVSGTKYGVLVEHTVISDGDVKLPDFALSRRVAGIFQISPLLSEAYVKRLREYVPSVVEIGAVNNECDSVYTDYSEIVSRSFALLHEMGHRRIAFINCTAESRTEASRLNGYITSLKKYGIEYNDGWVKSSSFNGRGGYNAFGNIWNCSEEKPTAVICATSVIAGGALHFMHENGISVPSDVSVICNGDSVITEFSTPNLTAISRDKREIARAAFSLMMERLSSPSLPPRAVKTDIHLTMRDSVCAASEKK